MLQQNGKRFYKGLYVTFKLAPNIRKNTINLSSYSPFNEGHISILTNSMLRTYTSDIDERRRAYNSSIYRCIFLYFYRSIPISLYNDSVKVVKSDMLLLNYNE